MCKLVGSCLLVQSVTRQLQLWLSTVGLWHAFGTLACGAHTGWHAEAAASCRKPGLVGCGVVCCMSRHWCARAAAGEPGECPTAPCASALHCKLLHPLRGAAAAALLLECVNPLCPRQCIGCGTVVSCLGSRQVGSGSHICRDGWCCLLPPPAGRLLTASCSCRVQTAFFTFLCFCLASQHILQWVAGCRQRAAAVLAVGTCSSDIIV